MKLFMHTALFTLPLFVWSNHGQMQHKEAIAEPVTAEIAATCQDQQVILKVKGLVCDFCARSMEKVLKKKLKLKTVKVDLKQGQIRFKHPEPSTLHIPKLQQWVKDGGYNLSQIKLGCEKPIIVAKP